MQLFSLITIFRFLFHLYLLNKLSLLVWGVSSPLSSFLGVSSPLSSFLGFPPLCPPSWGFPPLCLPSWGFPPLCLGDADLARRRLWRGMAVRNSGSCGTRGTGVPPPLTCSNLIRGGALGVPLSCHRSEEVEVSVFLHPVLGFPLSSVVH